MKATAVFEVAMMRVRVSVICSAMALTLLGGCASFGSDEQAAKEERYYCRPGSMLKYKRPVGSAFAGYWIPMPDGGSCKGY